MEASRELLLGGKLKKRPSFVSALVVSALVCVAYSGLPVGSLAQARNESIMARFGARDPKTCADTKTPAGNNITPALAAKYFTCNVENLRENTLTLVQNVKVEVGGVTPYTPNLGSFPQINVRVPLRPIRGSYLLYSCKDLVREHSGPPSTSCYVYDHKRATGYCYKTTFNDWSCYMADSNAAGNSSYRSAGPKV